MIIAYLIEKNIIPYEITALNLGLLKKATWIDLHNPTKDEEAQVEEVLGLDIPTREEMVEIEISSRLYKENDKLFMTASVIAQSDSNEPKIDPVTFVLTHQHLITVRYIQPLAFKLASSSICKMNNIPKTAPALLIELLDAIIDRLADTLELVGHRIDDYSNTIFRKQYDNENKLDYKQLMLEIGTSGDLNTKARESLITFNRLIAFFEKTTGEMIDSNGELQLTTINRDITSLSDHANFLSSKINFLLDATLGMVNIEQNNIIKIFSVAAVIFLPPTLVASIYGMNFHFIPELNWKYGYLFAIGLIVLAAWVPYKYFKYRKWL